jgi:hypothetical protein
VELTATQVSLLAALIARGRARDHLPGQRPARPRPLGARAAGRDLCRRLAVLGRVAIYVAQPDKRPDPFEAVPGDQ